MNSKFEIYLVNLAALITPINQDSGIFPVSRIILNSFTYIGNRTGQDKIF